MRRRGKADILGATFVAVRRTPGLRSPTRTWKSRHGAVNPHPLVEADMTRATMSFDLKG
ncbi:MAG TPA: hypothetical protein PLM24_02620 [Methanothrix sp.]|nr:hypothetical protein [Methanothrix sp.]HPR66011.1 hypothetical protein [Methanothrix sp.]